MFTEGGCSALASNARHAASDPQNAGEGRRVREALGLTIPETLLATADKVIR
jgi:hypothetical protein